MREKERDGKGRVRGRGRGLRKSVVEIETGKDT